MGAFNLAADLKRFFDKFDERISALERIKVTHGTGAPGNSTPEPYVDDAGSRVYYKVGGAWKSTALT